MWALIHSVYEDRAKRNSRSNKYKTGSSFPAYILQIYNLLFLLSCKLIQRPLSKKNNCAQSLANGRGGIQSPQISQLVGAEQPPSCPKLLLSFTLASSLTSTGHSEQASSEATSCVQWNGSGSAWRNQSCSSSGHCLPSSGAGRWSSKTRLWTSNSPGKVLK